MSVTREQSMANAKTAAAVIARQFGFYQNDGSGFTMGTLSAEHQLQLGEALGAYVVAHPQLFTEQALAAATYHVSLPLTGRPAVDPSMTLGQFSEAFLEEARITLPNVGNKILIAAVIVACVYVFTTQGGFRGVLPKISPTS